MTANPFRDNRDGVTTNFPTQPPIPLSPSILLYVLTMGKTDYDRMREANIARNKALLASLGVEKSVGVMVEQHRASKKPAPAVSKKRKARDEDEYSQDEDNTDEDEEKDDGEDEERLKKKSKARRKAPAESASDGPRRSGRNAGRVVDYKSEKSASIGHPVPASVSRKRGEALKEGPMGRSAGSKRLHNP